MGKLIILENVKNNKTLPCAKFQDTVLFPLLKSLRINCFTRLTTAFHPGRNRIEAPISFCGLTSAGNLRTRLHNLWLLLVLLLSETRCYLSFLHMDTWINVQKTILGLLMKCYAFIITVITIIF